MKPSGPPTIVVLRVADVMLYVPEPSAEYAAVYQLPVSYETIFSWPAPGKPAGTKLSAPTELAAPVGPWRRFSDSRDAGPMMPSVVRSTILSVIVLPGL